MGFRRWSWEEERYLDSRGRLVTRWRRVLPTIKDRLLDSIVYLYANEDDARLGSHSGGSGFIVQVEKRGTRRGECHLFVVTNRHVIDGGYTTIRATSRTQDVVILEGPPVWAYPESDDDAAVWAFSAAVATPDMNFACVDIREFVSPRYPHVGVGDECVMLGRFMGRDGMTRNSPTARFGNVAMKAEPHIENAFYVETRSQAGFSGSPIFVYYEKPKIKVGLPALTELQERPSRSHSVEATLSERYQFWLLGIGSEQVHHLAKTRSRLRREPVELDYDIVVGSGILKIVPAWTLAALLEREARTLEEKAEASPEPMLLPEVAAGEAPQTVENTKALLGELFQVPKEERRET